MTSSISASILRRSGEQTTSSPVSRGALLTRRDAPGAARRSAARRADTLHQPAVRTRRQMTAARAAPAARAHAKRAGRRTGRAPRPRPERRHAPRPAAVADRCSWPPAESADRQLQMTVGPRRRRRCANCGADWPIFGAETAAARSDGRAGAGAGSSAVEHRGRAGSEMALLRSRRVRRGRRWGRADDEVGCSPGSVVVNKGYAFFGERKREREREREHFICRHLVHIKNSVMMSNVKNTERLKMFTKKPSYC